MVLSNVLDKLKNDAHIPIGLLVWGVTTAYVMMTHRDLGANYVNSLYALYGFLTAHGGVTLWKNLKEGQNVNDTPDPDGAK